MYSLGYRLDEDFRLKKTGGLYIASDISGSEIFIDGELEKRTNLLQGGVFIDNLAPGKHEILVLHQDYSPWTKTLEVYSQLVTEARALLIPRDLDAEILLRGKFLKIYASPIDPVLLLIEGNTAQKTLNWFIPETKAFLSLGTSLKFQKTFEIIRWLPQGALLKLDGRIYRVSFDIPLSRAELVDPGGEIPKKSEEEILSETRRRDARERVEISLDTKNNTIKALWIAETNSPYYLPNKKELILKDKPIRNFEIYPRRSDAILAAFDNGIWALEINGSGARGIQALYKGKEPDFVLFPGDNQIYILDDGILIKASLLAKE